MNIDRILFRYEHAHEHLPDEQLDEVKRLNPDYQWGKHEVKEDKFIAARWLCYKRAEAEATRLGYQSHPQIGFLHDPLVLIEAAAGVEEGRALATKYGLEWHGPANCMWDPLSWRREGDAVIALIGADRGWHGGIYWVAVAWAPLALEEENGGHVPDLY
jgi:hypothetical protein